VKLIVALDFRDQNEALSLVDQLDPSTCALKVGLEMFVHFGGAFVKTLVARAFPIFLDLKFHDIPNTVAQSCVAAADLGVWMMNVHASGGFSMMHAARTALDSYQKERPLLIAVTALTSLSVDDLPTIGIDAPLSSHVTKLACLAKFAGLDGVVSSAQEVSCIKDACGSSFLTITPGIRMPDDESHDQKRLMTPSDAIRLGSDYLVMGRSITRATNPASRVRDILQVIS
jgi:orotidine-5'-phosphate decarboxylase